VPAYDRVYLNESGIDECDDYRYGWCGLGVCFESLKFESLKSGRRGERINIISAPCEHQLSSAFTINGSCNRVIFETWLEQYLLPTLKPGKVLILILYEKRWSQFRRMLCPNSVVHISLSNLAWSDRYSVGGLV